MVDFKRRVSDDSSSKPQRYALSVPFVVHDFVTQTPQPQASFSKYMKGKFLPTLSHQTPWIHNL
jgi:hypothetical protein